MQNELAPELQASLDIITNSFRRQFSHFQDRQDRRAIARRMDQKYDLLRLLRGLRENDTARLAPHEHACSAQIAERRGREPKPGFAFVPISTRALTAGVASAGGHLISTETAPGDTFVEFLHGSSVLIRQSISRLALTGAASVPRTSANIATYWVSEGTALTESQFSFAVAAATPKSCGAYTQISDRWIKQASPAAQTFIWREMARSTAAELDSKVLNGSGASGQPTGILNTAGIGSVSGTSLGYAGILDAIKNVEDASGLVDPTRASFVLAPDAARLLRSREKATGSGMILSGTDLAGYGAQTTKSVPDSSLLFGDWSQFVLCEWGTLEVGIDPYGADGGLFKQGLIGLRALWTVDALVLHPESFCKIASIT